MTPWYIDALDARAGLAVATARSPNLGTKVPFETGPSIFIAAPDFVPEFLGSRAIGFGLARGIAQIGVFADGEEVPFPSPEAVAEFVRRVFLRGSSGDGPGEGGGAPPLGPEDGGPIPDIPAGDGRDRDGKDPIFLLQKFAKNMAERVASCSVGNAVAPIDLVVTPATTGGAAYLLSAARRIHFELMVRAGLSLDEDWARSAQRFIAVLCRLGIAGSSLKFLPVGPPGNFDNLAADVRHFFNFLNHDFRDYPFWLAGPVCCGATVAAADPFEDLGLLPAPRQFVPHGNPSLQNLLAGFIASPQAFTIMTGPNPPDAGLELALFAACYIVLGSDRSLMTFDLSKEGWMAMADRLVLRALQWIAQNLPKLTFNRTVEAVIVSAAAIPA